MNTPTHEPGPEPRTRDALGRGPMSRLWSRGFAAFYEPLNASAEKAGVGRWRTELLAQAHGETLEIGAGTGTNLAHYPRDLKRLTLAEPDPAMRERLDRRLAELGRDSALSDTAESIAAGDQTFDTVVSTYVLCSVDLGAALAEIRRVLRPDGQLLFCEHVRSPSPRLARWQDRLNRPWRAFACGCNCNRDTEGALRREGFEITSIERGGLEQEVALVRPTIRGRAVPGPRPEKRPERDATLDVEKRRSAPLIG